MNEDFHTSIENTFRPFLDSMLSGNLAFYTDREAVANFFRGLAAQYLRTDIAKNGQRKRIWKAQEFELFERTANVLVQIYAVNLGHSLYVDRDRYKLAILENHSDVPFITADQPVINIGSSPKETNPPEKFELYYPLSPKKAMLLVDHTSDHLPHELSVSAMSVHVYNSHMAAHSYQQIYGSSREVLESVRDNLSAMRSCL